jgi:TolA-binding protein
MGRMDEAREVLQSVVAATDASVTVGGTARLFLARVEVGAGLTDEAVTLLQRLADDPGAVIPPALALLELGRVQHDAGRETQARAVWQRIVDEYPQSVSAGEARTLLR